MRKSILALAGLAAAVAVVLPSTVIGGDDGRKVLEARSMAGVPLAYTAARSPIRGVNGGGLPWEIDAGEVSLRANGRLKVEVEGLVLGRSAPVPATLQGTNPITTFRAIVSCQTVDATGAASVANAITDPFPASTAGDAEFEGRVDLPSPCIAPIVFVTSPGGAWFAATGR